MLDLTAIHRARYCPSGKIVTTRFVRVSLLLLLASCICGCILMLLYSVVGLVPMLFVFVVLVPIAIAVSVGWLIGKLVEYSHCRNLMAASSIGAICGAVVFLSACHTAGVMAACRSGEPLSVAVLRVDRIPEVIISRMYAPNVNHQRSDDFSRLNVPRTVLLIIELGILTWIPLRLGRSAAGRAYNELSGSWLKRSLVRATSGSGDKIVAALQAEQDLTSTLTSLELCSSDPRPTDPKFVKVSFQEKQNAASAWMLFEFQGDQASDDCQTAYLTVTEIDSKGKRKMVLQQLQLQSSEILAATKLFVR